MALCGVAIFKAGAQKGLRGFGALRKAQVASRRVTGAGVLVQYFGHVGGGLGLVFLEKVSVGPSPGKEGVKIKWMLVVMTMVVMGNE